MKTTSIKAFEMKEALKNMRPTVGSWITLAHPAIAEIMAKAGFEWLAVDLEHSVITIREAEELIRIIDLCGVVPLVRLSANDPIQIKRVMDAGAHGVIVPMVNSKEDAIQAVRAVKYPPAGGRGVGFARAQGYGTNFDKYREWLAQKSVVIAQIEHIDAVNNLEDILNVNGIDGTIIGPYDLSGSLGKPGEFHDPAVRDALKKYEDVCNKMKKPMGSHIVQPDSKMAAEHMGKGYVFLAVGIDMLYLGHGCTDLINEVKKCI